MPHLDYLTYLSQIFWFLLFFWVAYFLFFFIFFPRLYYSFRIRKLKFDFLFDKYISSEYKVNFYSFFFKDYSDKYMTLFFSYLKSLKFKYNLSFSAFYKKSRSLNFFTNIFFSEILFFYWSKGITTNFSLFLNSVFFSDWKKYSSLNKINTIYFNKN